MTAPQLTISLVAVLIFFAALVREGDREHTEVHWFTMFALLVGVVVEGGRALYLTWALQ